jgi:UDP-N-acetylmuramoyl-L-alanyl-D-glutamate--2,6-diaminopimelate ligase
MLLSELIQGLPITVVRGDPASVRVTDITEDSRTVMPGAMFVARRGLTSDGTAYIVDAVRAGAAVILTESTDTDTRGIASLACDDARLCMALCAERLYGNPSGRLLVAGVTGTNGKSTVAHLVHGLMNRAGVRCGMIGTVAIDDGTECAPSAMTTPPAIEISRTLATMVDAGCEAAVMEVSSHALDQRRADAVAFDAGVFTNITGDHADYHESFEAYLAAKQRLLGLLTGDAPGILNIDDPHVAGSAHAVNSGRVVRCSAEGGDIQSDADWVVERDAGTGRSSIEGEPLTVRHAGHTISATVPLIGGFNAMNVCQALAAAWALLEKAGMDEDERAQRLGQALTLATAPPGRLEPVHSASDDVRVLVDYAHTDDALDRVLSTVRDACGSGTELTVVFGCGGDRDREKRPRMGEVAARHADRIVLTSDNPRSEPPSAIIDAILTGIPADARARTAVHAERGEAIRRAILDAASNGVVVIAGKGHETDQVSCDAAGRPVVRRFVDQEHARGALVERRAGVLS